MFKRIISALIFLSFLSYLPVALSEEQKIKLLTTNLNEPYKVVGFVSYRSGFPDLDKINEHLIKQAKGLDADYVIGIRYITYASYLFAYGTAVKTVKTKSK